MMRLKLSVVGRMSTMVDKLPTVVAASINW